MIQMSKYEEADQVVLIRNLRKEEAVYVKYELMFKAIEESDPRPESNWIQGSITGLGKSVVYCFYTGFGRHIYGL